MDKSNLKKMALMGITGGFLLTSQAYADDSGSTVPGTLLAHYDSDSKDSPMPRNSSSKLMTEKELLAQLSAEGKSTYQSLDAEGKALALKLASQACKGMNDCKGQNSCKSKANSCAGEAGCKGTSPGPFSDKNEAVKVAAKVMAEKRAKMSR